MFLTFAARLTFLVWNANEDKSREYRNDENSIKLWNGLPYGGFSQRLEPVKKEHTRILDDRTQIRHRCP
jgi:hypothetical protein